jgi:LysR family cyn operon transcriptional activator
MTIDIRDLRYCEAIARYGSITKAAKELRIAQPSLSAAIKKLEDELGVVLFTRKARKTLPTPQTRLLLRRAERILNEINLAHEELRAAAELGASEVRIGMMPMYGLHFLPSIITKFHTAFPSVVTTAVEGSGEEIRAMLDREVIDLGMLENCQVPAKCDSIEVGQDEIVLCVPKEHAFAGKTSVTPQDLDDMPMVVLDPSFLQRGVVDQLCKRAGVQFRLVLQSNFAPLIHRAVVDGLGVSALLRSTVEQDSRVVPLPFSPPEFVHFSLCWRQEQALSKANAIFVDVATGRYQRRG